MGFFSDLKEDLAQAVNELTEDTTEKELLEEEELLKQELSEMEDEFQVSGVDETTTDEYAHYMAEEAVYDTEALETDLGIDESFEGVNEEVMATLSAGFANATENLPDAEEDALVEEFEAALAGLEMSDDAVEELLENADESVVEADNEIGEVEEIEEIMENEEVMEMAQEEIKMPVVQEDTFVSMADENAEVGIIPAGMMITGDIKTEGAIDLRGTVLGNIEIGGKLNVSGSIQGNSKAVEIFAQAAKITGDVECDNSVKIGPNSVVIGNISARSAVIAGAVKGDIDVRGPVILDSSAIIKGNIKSKSVQINNGAAVEGMCSQCYADVNPTSFFEGLE